MTLWASCGADVTAKVDNAVAKVGLNILFDAFVEDFFYFSGIFFAFGVKSKPAAYAYAVCIGDDIRFAKHVAEHEICYFASDTGQGEESLHRIGNFSVKVTEDNVT